MIFISGNFPHFYKTLYNDLFTRTPPNTSLLLNKFMLLLWYSFNVKLVTPRITSINLAYITTAKATFDDELFLRNDWPTKDAYALFPAGTMVRDSHHLKSLTHRAQGLNLHRIWMKLCSSDKHYTTAWLGGRFDCPPDFGIPSQKILVIENVFFRP